MPIHLYFVRHGQASANRFHRLCGSNIDPPLTKKGLKQAMECLYDLSQLKPDAIYCSPLQRARQTAAIAVKGMTDPPKIIYEDLLKERSFGKIDGSFSLLKLKKVWDYDQSYIKSNYGEETLNELENRVETFLKMVQVRHPNQTVIVFSHGGIGTAIHATLTKDHDRSGFYFKHLHLKNGQIVEFLL